MVYNDWINNGIVIIEGEEKLPEGAKVRLEVITEEEGKFKSLREGLLKLAGTVEGLPPDAAKNYDHYLYGTPKHND